jgi:hypothetical protein
MKHISENALSFFAFVATVQFMSIFIQRIYNLGRLSIRYGPCNLNEILWLKEIIISILIGLICGWIANMMDKAEKAQGKELHIPRIKFKNFATAILFFTTLFFGFIFIFVVREYNEYAAQVTYMFQRTFMQYCATNIPWIEIVATSLIFGIILAIGFSSTTDEKSLKDKEVE